MAVESINDANFGGFCRNEKAVLVFSLSTCPACKSYAPVVDRLAKRLMDVKFGQAILDKLPRDGVVHQVFWELHEGRSTVGYPTTLVLQMGRNPMLFAGAYGFEDALDVISQILQPGGIRFEDSVATLHPVPSNDLL